MVQRDVKFYCRLPVRIVIIVTWRDWAADYRDRKNSPRRFCRGKEKVFWVFHLLLLQNLMMILSTTIARGLL